MPRKKIEILKGRPPEFTEKHLKSLFKLPKGMTSKVELAAGLGISRKTLYNWIEKYPEFAEAVDTVMTNSDASYISWLRKGMQKEVPIDSTAAALYGNNVLRWKDENPDKQINIKTVNILHMKSPEELEILARRLLIPKEVKEIDDGS